MDILGERTKRVVVHQDFKPGERVSIDPRPVIERAVDGIERVNKSDTSMVLGIGDSPSKCRHLWAKEGGVAARGRSRGIARRRSLPAGQAAEPQGVAREGGERIWRQLPKRRSLPARPAAEPRGLAHEANGKRDFIHSFGAVPPCERQSREICSKSMRRRAVYCKGNQLVIDSRAGREAGLVMDDAFRACGLITWSILDPN